MFASPPTPALAVERDDVAVSTDHPEVEFIDPTPRDRERFSRRVRARGSLMTAASEAARALSDPDLGEPPTPPAPSTTHFLTDS